MRCTSCTSRIGALVRPDHIVYGIAADLEGARALLERARIALGVASTGTPVPMLD
jgi:hypothetical protein